MAQYDATVIGGGIVGLSTAMALISSRKGLRVLLLEKERQLAFHQTGRNSGVIHSGVYYAPGSMKARLCVQGARTLIAFCQQHRIPYQICGKLIVATQPEELPRLEELHRRALSNGVQGCSLLGPERMREIEPNAAGIQALHVPTTGITDYTQVAQAFAHQIQEGGGTILTRCRLLRVTREDGRLRLFTTQGEFQTGLLINCGGLHADRIAESGNGSFRRASRLRSRQAPRGEIAFLKRDFSASPRNDGKLTHSPESARVKIIPFRGEYFELVPEKRNLVRGLIYPVPDPRFPFLGVHLSRRIDGRVEAGPSAVLALKREGYRKMDVSLRDLAEMLSYSGFWRMSARHWKTGLYELRRSFSKRMFVRDVQRLVPAVSENDFVPSGSGVRAQAVDGAGNLLDDFRLIQAGRMIHVVNAPSPAATASLAIGDQIARSAVAQLITERPAYA